MKENLRKKAYNSYWDRKGTMLNSKYSYIVFKM